MNGRPTERSYRFLAAVLRPLLAAVVRREGRGAENLPADGGFVVCSNHLSYLDPFTLADYLLEHGRPGYFLAKESVFRIPVVGRIVRRCGQIPVRRYSADASAALTLAEAAIHQGRCVVVYPEGTLTRDPDLWPMAGRTGAARLALATGCPVVPVAQWGPQAVLAPYHRWPRLLPRATVQVAAGPPVALDDLRDRPVDAELLALATGRITDAVTGLLAGLRGQTPPHQHLSPWEGDRSGGRPGLRPPGTPPSGEQQHDRPRGRQDGHPTDPGPAHKEAS